ncbi:unnamed protein product [Hydatigera taeniaeformis]|uniref:BACK domain-containing protein n=1 Tax=Hydatigena taeniaeformis TaxID=6205 RepID=A0A0R3X1J1_HYDTA|nr:unnamed protein product [Hydatigera taeniaeformis]
MLKPSKSHLVDRIGSSFSRMDEVYACICERSASLASVRRQKCRVEKHLGFMMPISIEVQLSPYIDARVLANVALSLGTSVARDLEEIFDSLVLLRTLALKVFDFCESLTNLLKEMLAKESCYLVAFNNVVEILMELAENMVDEIDLLFQWAYSIVLPEFGVAAVSPSFDFASSILSGKMLSASLWREEICPMLKFVNISGCS